MTEPTDYDEPEDREELEEEGSEGESSKGGAGGSGGVKMSAKGGEDESEQRSKVKDEGEGDSDSWGRGKAGAGSGLSGKFGVPPNKLKEIVGDWRHLDVNAVVEAVAEFFGDFPMRASANLSVVWENVKNKSFAIVNWVIDFGSKAADDLAVKRERERTSGAGRDTRRVQRRRPRTPSHGMNMAPGPSGPNE